MFRLRVLGEVTLLSDEGNPVEAVLSQPKRLALLIFLATHVGRHRHRRETVLSVFWPEGDEHHGRNALRQSLHFLRSHLGDELILNGGDALSVNDAMLTSDVRDFEIGVAEARYGDALSFYKGLFLEGFPSPTEEALESWISQQRAWLREIATRCAWTAATQAEEQQDLSAASGWWHRASELSPYDEAIAQRYIASLVALGNRGRAMDALRSFTNRLERDLEVQPSQSTLNAIRRTMATVGSERSQNRTPWPSHEGLALGNGSSGYPLSP